MGFLNNVHTIIRKSNGNLFDFYIEDQCLFSREFVWKKGWNEPDKLLEDTLKNQFDIKIDNQDMLYGVINNNRGEVIYLDSKKGKINYKIFFEFDSTKYMLVYPRILKIDPKIHITYYLQNNENKTMWAMINHYFDGETWHQNKVDMISANPVINPFYMTNSYELTSIFYINQVNGVEEITLRDFNVDSKNWMDKKEITSTKNPKLYLDVLKDNSDIYHIAWVEFIKENLVVRYKKFNIKDNNSNSHNVITLSQPSNCTFPTIIKTNKTLWVVWVQMNKLYSCFSLDEGKTWSNPKIDSKSLDVNFIRYRFCSNHPNDTDNFKLNNTFGTYKPSISFIGFKNLKG